jgi:benzylsuccinate CoA-transferase BbsE subunit
MFECQDGHIYMLAGGIGENKFWSRTVQWLMEEKVAGAEKLQGEEWRNPEYLRTEDAKRIFRQIFLPWSKTRTKAYLFHEGQRHHVPIAPVNTPADVLQSRQLKHRGYFVDLVHHLRSEPMLAPGAPYKLSETPWRMQRSAPRLGEHNAEVFSEIGVDSAALSQLHSARVTP